MQKNFPYNLSKYLIVCRSFSYCFLYLIKFCLAISYFSLILIVSPYARELDVGITINPNPVRLNVIELDVVAIVTNVSKDFSFVVNVLNFCICSWICFFCF